MYNENLAIAVKSQGKVLKEFKDIVYLPFGAEYSLLVKNLNSKKVAVRISIDGVSVTDGIDLIVEPNSKMDLKRFIKNGNLDKGNKFKFIERTDQIEKHRGIEIEDGLIRVEYQFEQPVSYYPTYTTATWTTGSPWYNYNGTSSGYNSYGLPVNNIGAVGSQSFGSVNVANSSGGSRGTSAGAPTTNTTSTHDAGITVPGGVSNQTFYQALSFALENAKHVMVLKLMGATNKRPVVKAITVKSKQECVTCGRKNKMFAKFCMDCGTALEIV